MNDMIKKTIQAHVSCAEAVLNDTQILKAIRLSVEKILSVLNSGGKILWCGNGGSAADCQHLSAELVARLNLNRKALASLALTTDTSFLTAWINDTNSADEIFSRQVEALAAPGDCLICITTSGVSSNICLAADAAKKAGCSCIALTGRDGGQLADRADIRMIVPSDSTQRIQEMHILIGHILCEYVEKATASS